MSLIVYIELFILSNLIIHLLSIFLVSKINNLVVTKGIIISSILDIIWMICYIFCYDFFARYTIFFGLLLILLCFKISFINYIKAIFTYYFVNYLLGGMVLTFNLKGNTLYLSFIFCYLFIVSCIYLVLVKDRYNCFYEIDLFLDKIYHFKAFFDTGCNLSYEGKPVIVINEKLKMKVNYCGLIKVYGATGEALVPCFYIPKVVIDKKEMKCYGIFLNVEYEAIIGVKFI